MTKYQQTLKNWQTKKQLLNLKNQKRKQQELTKWKIKI